MSDPSDEDITPEGAAFALEAISGMFEDWGSTNWLAVTHELMTLVCQDNFEEVDRRLATVDVKGPSILIFAHLRAAHPASHHLHEFEPLLVRAAAALDYDDADELRREFER